MTNNPPIDALEPKDKYMGQTAKAWFWWYIFAVTLGPVVGQFVLGFIKGLIYG